MYSAYKLNKQGDNIQPCHASFPILNQSVIPCPVLTFAFWPHRFLRRQVRWSGIPISLRIFQFLVIHTVRLSVGNEAEVDVFLELPCFLYDPTNAGNLISVSSASLKPSLYIWKFRVYVLLKPSLKDFENNVASCEMSTVVHFLFGTWKHEEVVPAPACTWSPSIPKVSSILHDAYRLPRLYNPTAHTSLQMVPSGSRSAHTVMCSHPENVDLEKGLWGSRKQEIPGILVFREL